ncbi:hypothetical protein [Rhizobium leguminosarum]|uniref:hypothetical protein n=1 Tax=Rhizobium leguminosarum TaxID=384 RepID=UPI001C950E31|nr:hypothetical protein [Rhizobium leguminosarum]MBY5318206.1 hypothetical protein [Rhizobium leguminosarum]
MPFQSRNHNPLAQVVELKSVVTESEQDPGRYALETELGIFEEEITLDKATISVGLTKASLSLAIDGLDIEEKTKFGVHHVPSQMMKVQRRTNIEAGIEETKAHELIASGEISMLTPTGKGSAARSGKTTHTAKASFQEESEVQIEHLPVKYVGNDTWRVTDPAGKTLDATYLNYDRLCDLKTKDAKPNRIRTVLSVHAKAKDISAVVTHDERFFGDRTKLNKEKVLGILVSKALHEIAEEAEYRGTITFSASVATNEG